MLDEEISSDNDNDHEELEIHGRDRTATKSQGWPGVTKLAGTATHPAGALEDVARVLVELAVELPGPKTVRKGR